MTPSPLPKTSPSIRRPLLNSWPSTKPTGCRNETARVTRSQVAPASALAPQVAPLAARLVPKAVIVTQTGRILTAAALRAGRVSLPVVARVALVVTDPAVFIRLLVALDGRVAAVLLLSYGLPADQVADLVRAAGCDTLLTNRADLLASDPGWDGVTVLAAETAQETAQEIPQEVPQETAPEPKPGQAAALDPALAPSLAPSLDTVQDTLWLLTTSGTTGLPKIVSHHLAGLAAAVRPARSGDPQPVWGHVIDPARLAGVLGC